MLGGMGKQLKFWFIATLTTLMVVAGSILQIGEPLLANVSGAAGCAASSCAIATANQLYTQYPDIPRAEQTNSTLLSRFIDYHLDAKERPANYHLDWELSMADYLEATYSDQTQSLGITKTDKLTMQTLSRQQRHDLVRSLEKSFAQWRP